GIRIPSRDEFNRVVDRYTKIISNAAEAGTEARYQASREALDLLKQTFNVKETGSTIKVEDDPTLLGTPGLGKYNPFSDAITISTSASEAEDATEVVWALLVLVHESIHSEQAAEWFWGNELEAYRGQLSVLQALYAAHVITVDTYITLFNEIDPRIREE